MLWLGVFLIPFLKPDFYLTYFIAGFNFLFFFITFGTTCFIFVKSFLYLYLYTSVGKCVCLWMDPLQCHFSFLVVIKPLCDTFLCLCVYIYLKLMLSSLNIPNDTHVTILQFLKSFHLDILILSKVTHCNNIIIRTGTLKLFNKLQ